MFFECARARRPLALTRALFSAPLSPRGSLLKYYRYKKEGSLAGWRGIPADAAASAGGAFDHEACIEAFAAALQALEPEAGEDEEEDADYDWGQLGVSWKDGGDIVLSDGTVLHAVGTE